VPNSHAVARSNNYAGPIRTGPTQCIQPSIQAELGCRIGKLAITVVLANLNRLIPPSPARTVFGEAAWWLYT
jgi:hypothetical protein